MLAGTAARRGRASTLIVRLCQEQGQQGAERVQGCASGVVAALSCRLVGVAEVASVTLVVEISVRVVVAGRVW